MKILTALALKNQVSRRRAVFYNTRNLTHRIQKARRKTKK